jgi:hypothetical protein
MESCLAAAQEATFAGFDDSVLKAEFTDPKRRRLMETIYRMGFESGWRIREQQIAHGVEGLPAAEYLAKVEADPRRAQALQRARERVVSWDASQIKQPGWDHVFAAFVAGANEAQANPDATGHDFTRAADGYTKRVFEEVDPVSEAALRTESWRTHGGYPDGGVPDQYSGPAVPCGVRVGRGDQPMDPARVRELEQEKLDQRITALAVAHSADEFDDGGYLCYTFQFPGLREFVKECARLNVTNGVPACGEGQQ